MESRAFIPQSDIFGQLPRHELVPERTALLARGDDRLDRALANVLDREQPEPDGVALDSTTTLIVYGELVARLASREGSENTMAISSGWRTPLSRICG